MTVLSPTETIVWTVLPNGYDSTGDSLQLSVLITPNLAAGTTGTGTLADFSSWQDWPSNVSAFGSLLVEIGNQDRSLTVTYNATIPTGPLNSAMWTTLFPTTTVYQARDSLELELANFPVISFPAAQINDFVTGQYASYEPDQVPTLDTLASVYGAITPGLVGVVQQERFRRLAAERMAPGRGGKAKLANDLAAMNTPDAFAAQAYYHLAGLGPQPAGAIPPLDFHKALTMIGQHGLLQRALGLVLDLEVPLASVQNTGGGVPLITGTVSSDIYVSILFQTRSLTAHATSVNTIEITPRTQCNASTTVFEAYPLSSQIVGRQLTLGDPSSFTINQVEVDGAGLRASHFGSTVSRLQHRALGQSSSASPTVTVTASPPSLRTEGILVCEVNRGINFQNLVARQQSLYASIGTGTVPDLQAEDLVRGYVLDVFDSTGSAWNSTAERSCTYMAGSQTVSGNDEASHQTPPRMQSSPTPGETTPQLNLSPVILRFTGWSTAAPRPFDVIPDADSMATAPTPSPFTASEITIAVVPVPGSVPRLRFGVSYALRARIVDVANNVLALSDGASVGDSQNRVSPLAEYLRLEPIGSPDIYDQSAPRLGETLQRLVIRDTDDSTPSVRALAPMPISAWFAEVHSMFDTGPGGALDPKAYGVITPAESKRYATTSPLAVGVTPPAISLTDPVPFLPDPVARGGALAVQNDAIAGDPTVSFDFSPAPGDSWPNYRPFGLRIAPGSQIAATVDTNARIVTFTLTPGDTVFLQLSSTCDVGDLKLFGLGSFFSSFEPASAAAGQYWGITPAVTLELVYAVQRPLLNPALYIGNPAREEGATFVEVVGYVQYSPKSTASIDLLASWLEPIDDPINDVGPIGPGAPESAPKQVSNSPVFPLADLPGLELPEACIDNEDTDTFAGVHEFHDTKHRNVTYTAIASSRFTEFYPPGTDVTVVTEQPPTLNVPSSARPASLDISSVIPSFTWTTAGRYPHLTSERSPAALRVYIDRPWWSSGIDELLGVVTWPLAEPLGPITVPFARDLARPGGPPIVVGPGGRTSPGRITAPPIHIPATTISSEYASYVTDWGADPVFAGEPLRWPHPRLLTFTASVAAGNGLSIDEDDSLVVNVAGHQVAYDPTQKKWYCDIEVDTGNAYTPMIRLALARYQPNSIAGVELGRISLVDIMSLDPGRVVTIVLGGKTKLNHVALSGVSYSRAAAAKDVAPGIAQITVERRDPGIKDETIGWQAVGDPYTMTPHGSGPDTIWTIDNIALPGGGHQLRLLIQQFEVLPTDQRSRTARRVVASDQGSGQTRRDIVLRQGRPPELLQGPTRGYRLVHQDVVPI